MYHEFKKLAKRKGKILKGANTLFFCFFPNICIDFFEWKNTILFLENVPVSHCKTPFWLFGTKNINFIFWGKFFLFIILIPLSRNAFKLGFFKSFFSCHLLFFLVIKSNWFVSVFTNFYQLYSWKYIIS